MRVPILWRLLASRRAKRMARAAGQAALAAQMATDLHYAQGAREAADRVERETVARVCAARRKTDTLLLKTVARVQAASEMFDPAAVRRVREGLDRTGPTTA